MADRAIYLNGQFLPEAEAQQQIVELGGQKMTWQYAHMLTTMGTLMLTAAHDELVKFKGGWICLTL